MIDHFQENLVQYNILHMYSIDWINKKNQVVISQLNSQENLPPVSDLSKGSKHLSSPIDLVVEESSTGGGRPIGAKCYMDAGQYKNYIPSWYTIWFFFDLCNFKTPNA